MNISVTAKSVYGETKFYPANEAARKLAEIAGTKTLTERSIRLAREMGCTVQLVGDQALARQFLAA